MSECVVRMEMPKDKNCLLNFSLPKIGPWCWIEDRACDYYKTNNRPDWCPIICQLPKGHGRLVDAVAAVNDIKYEILEYKMEGMKGTPMPTEHLWLMKNWIADEDICPTIVPAERSET